MDPDANLRAQREVGNAINKIVDACPEDGTYTQEQLLELSLLAGRLAELVEALDGWIRGKGFLPTSWRIAQGGRNTRTRPAFCANSPACAKTGCADCERSFGPRRN